MNSFVLHGCIKEVWK